MNDRLRELRKKLGLNQREFSEIINIGSSTLAMFETGQRIPKEIHIKRICLEFNVNEEWLRTGKGEMFKPKDRYSEIAKLTKTLLDEENDSFKNRLISVLANLTVEQWELLADIAEKITKKD